jgi:hypothetical protein
MSMPAPAAFSHFCAPVIMPSIVASIVLDKAWLLRAAAHAAMEHRADWNERLENGEIQPLLSDLKHMQARGALETC